MSFDVVNFDETSALIIASLVGASSAVVRPSRLPTAAEARAYLESLPDLWEKTSDAGR
jgi:hypothetical protein